MSLDQLAEAVNDWCRENQVHPASGQAGERITGRNIRYYRSLGLVDPPLGNGAGKGYGSRHRRQLMAIRLLQAQGLPLNRIQELIFGRTEEELQVIEERGLQDLTRLQPPAFPPVNTETWNVVPLDDDFLLVSRRGRMVSPALRQQLANLIKNDSSQGVVLTESLEPSTTSKPRKGRRT